MTSEQIIDTATGMAKSMSNRNPFMAVMLIMICAVLVFALWNNFRQNNEFLAEQRTQNIRLLELQKETLEDRRKKSEVIKELTGVMREANTVGKQTADYMRNLVAISGYQADQNRQINKEVSERLDRGRDAMLNANRSIKDLHQYFRERDSRMRVPSINNQEKKK